MSETVHTSPGAGARGSLRDRLRADTRAAHAALDERVSGFDLATVPGLRGFLTMQARALTALAGVSDGAACAPIITSLGARARVDLARLPGGVPDTGAAKVARPHPLALDYVITGSRLGTRVLKQRWAASADPAVRGVGAYFGAPDHVDAWRAFCNEASVRAGEGAEADRIVADAVALFYFYDTCARSAAPRQKEANV